MSAGLQSSLLLDHVSAERAIPSRDYRDDQNWFLLAPLRTCVTGLCNNGRASNTRSCFHPPVPCKLPSTMSSESYIRKQLFFFIHHVAT